MSDFDWQRVRQIKDLYRAKLTALPFEEKLHILERLRLRASELRGMWQPTSAGERSATSNVRAFVGSWLFTASVPIVASLPPVQTVSNATRLDMFGPSTTLLFAADFTQSSTLPTTIAATKSNDGSHP